MKRSYPTSEVSCEFKSKVKMGRPEKHTDEKVLESLLEFQRKHPDGSKKYTFAEITEAMPEGSISYSSLSRRYITVYSTPKTLTQQRIYDVLHHIHTFTSKKPATRYTPIVDWHDFKSTPEAVAIDFEPSGLALLADAVDALTASMEWEEKESTYEKESVSNF